MKVFISWSGKRSKAIAQVLSDWLPFVIQNIKTWMSDKDIRKGDRWFSEIGKNLKECDVGIICVTPENIESPWLMFEAGALSKQIGESSVCPLLLGIEPSVLEGPLSQFQATVINKEDILKLVLLLKERQASNIDNEIIIKSFNRFWFDFERKIKKIELIRIQSENLENVVKALQGRGLPSPQIGRIVSFKEGFESHGLYETVFNLSENRLYIFGRKNRKVFDKEHYDFYKNLASKIKYGLDFKCLFLDVNSPSQVLFDAHEDDNFMDQLKIYSKRAVKVLNENGIDPDTVCRAYRIQRTHAFIVSDDTVLFTPIELCNDGKAKHLTKCRFQVIDINLPLGQELLNNFISNWETSRPITQTLKGG